MKFRSPEWLDNVISVFFFYRMKAMIVNEVPRLHRRETTWIIYNDWVFSDFLEAEGGVYVLRVGACV